MSAQRFRSEEGVMSKEGSSVLREGGIRLQRKGGWKMLLVKVQKMEGRSWGENLRGKDGIAKLGRGRFLLLGPWNWSGKE